MSGTTTLTTPTRVAKLRRQPRLGPLVNGLRGCWDVSRRRPFIGRAGVVPDG